ncbi:hypothetical protein LVB77_14640 [Lysobacter sp. 5GHs7-4]|uniref:Rz1-like lysis system protein LysC n=1 Tax=Lysobacter sp. 5GHs7-4 TaxID=2904253 RepID=UPI001E53077B|nr:hypothetical protein [Lysobacter sp. 5GHs7-4]UHQ21904.1 hypothetical protein LVB77_14640 [Lysobacter sp. 5GHs7-4]
MRCISLIAIAALLSSGWTSCSRRPEAPELPKVVYVPVEKIVDVPAELTADCEKVPKRNNSLAEAVRLANARDLANDECTSRMRQIRGLKQKPAADGM